MRPSGTTYLMEDFYFAGGLPALMTRIRDRLHLDAVTVNGKTLGDIARAEVYNDDIIRTSTTPSTRRAPLPCSRVISPLTVA